MRCQTPAAKKGCLPSDTGVRNCCISAQTGELSSNHAGLKTLPAACITLLNLCWVSMLFGLGLFLIPFQTTNKAPLAKQAILPAAVVRVRRLLHPMVEIPWPNLQCRPRICSAILRSKAICDPNSTLAATSLHFLRCSSNLTFQETSGLV